MSKAIRIFVLACVLGIGSGLTNLAWADAIGPGFDLFSTPPGGAFLDLSPLGVGIIPLTGNGIGGSDTDTIVERLGGLPAGGTGVIPIELVALSLMSVDPVPIPAFGGSFFDVFVTINAGLFPASVLPQPDALAPSMGTMVVTSHNDPTGGTFDSFFDVFADIIFKDTATGAVSSFPSPLVTLSSTGTPWVHTASPSFGAYPTGGFFVPGGITHTGPHPHNNPANTPPPPPIPEPGTIFLLGSGLAGIIGVARKKLSERA